MAKIGNIFKKLNIDDTYTKKPKYKFDKVRSSTFPKHGYNEMADLLMLPKTDSGYKYCLTMVDLWSNYFDFEPMKTKTAKESLEAMLKIFKRHYLTQPEASLKTDSGAEFQGVFNQWLHEHHIAHLVSLPNRHRQLANVENLNKQLGKIFMTYLTHKSIELGHEYTNWDDIVDDVRQELNKLKIHPKDENPYTYPMSEPNISSPPKYNVGDIVYRVLEKPSSIGGNQLYGSFRSGDRRFDLVPRKVSKVFLYNNNWRYILTGFPQVAYAERELLPAKEKEERTEIKAIIGKKKENGVVKYLVHWKGHKKSESTYESESNLKEDLGQEGFDELIEDYKESLKRKRKRKT